MSVPKKWWLISDEDVQMVRRGLLNANPEIRDEGLYALDTGLHKTDGVPEDWRKKE